MKFLRKKAKNRVQQEKDPHIWVRKKNRNAHKKILKIWRRKERKNSAPLELLFPSPTTSLQFCSKPITAFSIPLLQHTYKKPKTHSCFY
jgi:hypothetical protein